MCPMIARCPANLLNLVVVTLTDQLLVNSTKYDAAHYAMLTTLYSFLSDKEQEDQRL
jgi:hypothetical protein